MAFVFLADNSNFTPIISSRVISEIAFKVSSFIRPSFFKDKINEPFLLFLVDTPSPLWYNVYVWLIVCVYVFTLGGIMLDLEYQELQGCCLVALHIYQAIV